MEIHGSQFSIRPYRQGDEESLQRNADNRMIAENLGKGFPNPYTLDDARGWIRLCEDEGTRSTRFAIVIDDSVVGGMGCEFEPRCTSQTREIGYWLGEEYWGRGIVTEAVGNFVSYVFDEFGVRRLQAQVFSWNPASGRVLEKNGFELEGRLREAACKLDETGDVLIYGRLR